RTRQAQKRLAAALRLRARQPDDRDARRRLHQRIIALPVTAEHGTCSRIVPTLALGAGVVTTRAHVQTVVTEYGVAELHGRRIAERARARRHRRATVSRRAVGARARGAPGA